MSMVTIRRCPVCQTIGNETKQVIESLRRESGLKVNVVDGERGEFTVEVDGRRVAEKRSDLMPTVNDVVDAVKQAAHEGATA